jgi:isopenicillin N synthase-like dioxygenase
MTTTLEPGVSNFAINGYPAFAGVSESWQRILVASHSDSGTLTILHQRGSYEGLEAQNPDGLWVKVPVIPDAFVINLGDLMARWSSGRFAATAHRVVGSDNPSDSRTSLTTFHLPAVDTIIRPLLDPGAMDESTTPYEWESSYLRRIYSDAAHRYRGHPGEDKMRRYLEELGVDYNDRPRLAQETSGKSG